MGKTPLRVRQTSPRIAHEGHVTRPDFAYKIFGPAPYQGGLLLLPLDGKS